MKLMMFKTRQPLQRFVFLAIGLVLASFGGTQAAEPLPSWNEGPAKSAITAFVARVTQGREWPDGQGRARGARRERVLS